MLRRHAPFEQQLDQTRRCADLPPHPEPAIGDAVRAVQRLDWWYCQGRKQMTAVCLGRIPRVAVAFERALLAVFREKDTG